MGERRMSELLDISWAPETIAAWEKAWEDMKKPSYLMRSFMTELDERQAHKRNDELDNLFEGEKNA